MARRLVHDCSADTISAKLSDVSPVVFISLNFMPGAVRNQLTAGMVMRWKFSKRWRMMSIVASSARFVPSRMRFCMRAINVASSVAKYRT